MSDYTYERNPKGRLESEEWDNINWYYTDREPEHGRMLLIGDSISGGYRKLLREALKEELYLNAIATSKGLDNPYFFKTLDLLVEQQGNYKVVVFNNGLHGWHLSNEEYEEHYYKFANYFKKKFPEARLIFALTTPVREMNNLSVMDVRNEIVIKRNEIARKVAAYAGAEVVDYYSIIIDHPEYYSNDGVHLSGEASALLAQACMEKVNEQL